MYQYGNSGRQRVKWCLWSPTIACTDDELWAYFTKVSAATKSLHKSINRRRRRDRPRCSYIHERCEPCCRQLVASHQRACSNSVIHWASPVERKFRLELGELWEYDKCPGSSVPLSHRSTSKSVYAFLQNLQHHKRLAGSRQLSTKCKRTANTPFYII